MPILSQQKKSPRCFLRAAAEVKCALAGGLDPLSIVVFLLSVRGLMAVYFPEQFAYLFSNSAVYFDTVLNRLWLFLPLTVLYALSFWLRLYLREASLAAAVILNTPFWADIELHLFQQAALTGSGAAKLHCGLPAYF